MPVQLTINDEATEYLNKPGMVEFQRALDQYAKDLLAEAGRLEAAGKSTKGNPELTSTLVKDADLLLRRAYSKKRRSPVLVTVQIFASVGGFMTGLFADAEKLNDPVVFVLFITLLAVTITATVIGVVKD